MHIQKIPTILAIPSVSPSDLVKNYGYIHDVIYLLLHRTLLKM